MLPWEGEDTSWTTIRPCSSLTFGSVLAVTIASELAGVRSDVKGSGTFLPAFIDELGALTPEKLAQYAKVEVI